MANQNDSGGGCLLWFIDWIYTIINNRRVRKYNKQARPCTSVKAFMERRNEPGMRVIIGYNSN